VASGLFTAVTPPASGHRHAGRWAAVAALVVAAVALFAVLSRAESGPHFVDLTVTNPTDYDVSISVGGASGSASTLGVAGRHATVVFGQVADQGTTWVFAFAAQGEGGGGLTLARGDLTRAGWRLTVPPSVGELLRSRGAPLPP